MGKYKTTEFARIRCVKCNEVLDTLNPGREFDSIKECDCQVNKKIDYKEMDIDQIRELLKRKNITFSPQAKIETLIKKLEGA